PIVDDDVAAESIGEPISDDARNGVRTAAGWIRDDEPNGLVGIVIRSRGPRRRKSDQNRQETGQTRTPCTRALGLRSPVVRASTAVHNRHRLLSPRLPRTVATGASSCRAHKRQPLPSPATAGPLHRDVLPCACRAGTGAPPSAF